MNNNFKRIYLILLATHWSFDGVCNTLWFNVLLEPVSILKKYRIKA